MLVKPPTKKNNHTPLHMCKLNTLWLIRSNASERHERKREEKGGKGREREGEEGKRGGACVRACVCACMRARVSRTLRAGAPTSCASCKMRAALASLSARASAAPHVSMRDGHPAYAARHSSSDAAANAWGATGGGSKSPPPSSPYRALTKRVAASSEKLEGRTNISDAASRIPDAACA